MSGTRFAEVNDSAMTEFDFNKPDRNEAWLFLEMVWQGLEYLCQQVERVEKERVAKHGKNFGYIDFGNQPGDAMVCNYFLWYATALRNFIGVFKKAFSPTEDLEHEFANAILWRNKVAAHTSWVWARDDNAVTQDVSIMLFPEFNMKLDRHFEVGGMRLGLADTGESSPDWQWGLVRTHERLKEIVSKYAAAATPTPLSQGGGIGMKVAMNRKQLTILALLLWLLALLWMWWLPNERSARNSER
jgi:hypothetical protein